MGAAFVTGAGSGIGRATALRLARDGAAVAAFDRDDAAVAAVLKEIDALGGRGRAYVGDVSIADEVEDAVARTVAELGKLDAAAACAGIEVAGTVTDMSSADWDRAIAINLTGVMLTARYTVAAMVESGGGAFVAISSDAGVQGCIDWTPYSVSKHGVVGLVRCLALDYGPLGVRSNVVCPSLVKTPMGDRVLDAISAQEQGDALRLLPLARIASPDEIANVIRHLLSPEASYTNGLVYMVDGGETAGVFLGEVPE